MTPVASTTRAVLALAVAVQLAAGPALADDHPLASLGASLPFAFAGGAAERAQVEEAIEKAIGGMSFVVRPFARRKVSAGNRVFEHLTLARESDQLVVYRDDSLVRSPADGTPVDWTGSDGTTYRVSQRLSPGGLLQTFTGPDAERQNRFTFTADGTLRLEVEVRSARLPEPLTYALTYARAGLPAAR